MLIVVRRAAVCDLCWHSSFFVFPKYDPCSFHPVDCTCQPIPTFVFQLYCNKENEYHALVDSIVPFFFRLTFLQEIGCFALFHQLCFYLLSFSCQSLFSLEVCRRRFLRFLLDNVIKKNLPS